MRRHAVAAHAVRCCCRVFARVDLGTEISVSTAAKLNMATRLRYALDAAKGMTFLHQHRNNNPIICAAVRWHSILPTAKPSPHDRAALMPLVAVLQREGQRTLPLISRWLHLYFSLIWATWVHSRTSLQCRPLPPPNRPCGVHNGGVHNGCERCDCAEGGPWQWHEPGGGECGHGCRLGNQGHCRCAGMRCRSSS